MTLNSECLPYRTLSYLVIFLFYQPSVSKMQETVQDLIETSDTGSDGVETDSHECAIIICLYTHSEKIKTNRPCASQICIGVIIDLSIKTQLLCDVLIG